MVTIYCIVSIQVLREVPHNKNAFQWDAYRPLVDRIPACTGECLPLVPGGRGGCVSQHAMGQTTPPPWTDRHLWKHNLHTLRLRAVTSKLHCGGPNVLDNYHRSIVSYENCQHVCYHFTSFRSGVRQPSEEFYNQELFRICIFHSSRIKIPLNMPL